MSETREWVKRQSQATPVLFVDLDDTVRKGKATLGRFVNGPDDVEVFPEVPAILKAFKEAGWRVVAVTNQGGVALGWLDSEAAMAAIVATYEQCGQVFDRMMMCTHHPNATDPEMAVCWCRKPRIGLLVQACLGMADEHNEYYPPHLGLFVGDLPEDEECARNAGLRFMNAAEWRAGGWKQFLEGESPLYVTRAAPDHAN